jgi:hypothetical protein
MRWGHFIPFSDGLHLSMEIFRHAGAGLFLPWRNRMNDNQANLSKRSALPVRHHRIPDEARRARPIHGSEIVNAHSTSRTLRATEPIRNALILSGMSGGSGFSSSSRNRALTHPFLSYFAALKFSILVDWKSLFWNRRK